MSTLSNDIYRELRRRIILRELPPLTPISEAGVSREMKVSRTPAREALLRLKHEGLVEVKPPRGYVVRLWSEKEIRGRYAVRTAIEGAAIEWAAEAMTPVIHRRLLAICDEEEELINAGRLEETATADTRFHEALIAASGSREIIRAASVNQLSATVHVAPITPPRERCVVTLEEHRRIVEFLVEKKVAEAKAVLVKHLERPVKILAALAEQESFSRLVSSVGG